MGEDGFEALGVPEHAGLTRTLDIALRLSALEASVLPLAKSLASLIDAAHGVPVRLVGVGAVRDRILLTVAVSLGTIDDIKAGAPAAQSGLALVTAVVEHLHAYDPAITHIPDPASCEAQLAARLLATPEGSFLDRAGLLSLIG